MVNKACPLNDTVNHGISAHDVDSCYHRSHVFMMKNMVFVYSM